MISQTLLHLSLIPTIGPLTIKCLFEQVLQKGDDLYRFTISDYRALGISEGVAQKLAEGLRDQALFDREYALIEKTGVHWTTVADSIYPALLWHTYAPPAVLYWLGEPVWNNGPTLAAVGSRAGTLYGKRALDTILTPCIQQGMVIVSGGALGIDAMAHELTLAHNGATVVVLGSGLLKPAPLSNCRLFSRVIDRGGAMLSCFPLQTEPYPYNFPFRNRIISGMSRGCLVVQAAKGSGALITARFALDEGRNVYAVPGPFDDPLSAGCHELLQDGAQLTVESETILRDYPSLEVPVVKQTSLIQVQTKPEVKRALLNQKKENIEQGLVALCARPISLEELVELAGKTENELKAELFELQLAGKVEQDFAGLWLRV